MLRSGPDVYFVVARDDVLLGFSMLRGLDEGYEVPALGIFVDHLNQGRGIGRRLMTWTIEEARLLDCPAVRLSVYASNHSALALYRSLGFAEQERETIDRGGYPDEKIVMLLDLRC